MIEFKHLSTTEIVVFKFESNSAREPCFYKVVWKASEYLDFLHRTNQVEVFTSPDGRDNWQKIGATVERAGIPTAGKSVRVLHEIIH